jgi:glycosyltransferase involved in cell wall biosynthesis
MHGKKSQYRICVFTGHYAPHMGGVEQYNSALWSRIAMRGCSVLLITGNTDNAPERESLDGIEVLRLPVFNVINGRLPIIKPAPAFFRLLRYAREWRPDLVVTNTRFFPICVLGRFLAGLGKVPHFHIEHGSEHIKLGNGIINLIGHAWDHLMGGYVIRRADRSYGVSRSISVIAGHLGCKACGVMYNGVDSSIFRPGPSSLRERLGIADGTFLFVFAGRLIEDKGIKILLEAFKLLPKGLSCALAIAGSGHLEEYVNEESKRNPAVHFVGRLRQEEVLDLLRGGDCFILPTSYPEGLPTSILEAQAVGLPVITTPKGGNAEAVTDGVNGFIVPPGDVRSLMEAMRNAAKDPANAREMGKKGMLQVREKFDWEMVAGVMACEIEECMGRAVKWEK